MNDDTPNKKFHAQQKYESQFELATVTFMISNENQKMCTIPIVWIWLKWLSDATILHIDFKKIPGENPRTPRWTPTPLPKAAYGPVNKWYDGLREYHTPGGGVSALLKPTAPERYHQSYCMYVLDEK